MSAESVWPAWTEALSIAAGTVGAALAAVLAPIAMLFRRVARLEHSSEVASEALSALEKRADAHDATDDAIREALAALRESVARLPTRDEQDRRFDDLKRDYRAQRPSS